MKVTAEVYALYEPGCDPWYVGCTKQGLTRRLGQHRSGNSSTRPVVTVTITAATQIGLIERITGTVADCAQAEQAWLDYGREVGWPLVNIHDQGGYCAKRGRPLSEETKVKIRRALQSRPQRPDSAETRRRKSEGQRRRWQAVRESSEPGPVTLDG